MRAILGRRRGVVLLTLLALTLVGVALLVALGLYTTIELARFERGESRRTSLVLSGGQELAPGVNVRAVDLAGTLGRLKYSEVKTRPARPGQFRRVGGAWEIMLAPEDGDGAHDPRLVRLEMRGDRVARVQRDGQDVDRVALEGEVLTTADDRPGEDHRPVRLADAPLTLIAAVLAAEDHRFFEHHGLDLRGLLRAAWANTRAGRVTQGGSSITQQLVKNRLLTPRRTLGRKLSEAWLATVIEWRYPKERILEAYLNEVYLGQRGGLAVRGIGTAARAYFRKEIHQLSLGEGALLAGMIRAPNTTSPALDPERARRRRDGVLDRMRELGQIDAADQERAKREPVRPPGPLASGQFAPYFSDYVRQELEQRVGDRSAGRATRVVTSLDLALQRFAEAAVGRGLDRLETRYRRLRREDPAERLQVALVALDVATGEIRALVGGRDYRVSQFNRAAVARRQPGSAFKPFVYLAALAPREGRAAFTPASVVEDEPITLVVGRQEWTPRNYEDRYEGAVTVRRALERSLNSATVRIAQRVGYPAIIETAHRLGVRGDLAPVPAMALGAFEVTPLELARAYLAFADGGVLPGNTTAVRAIRGADGHPVALPVEKPTAVMSPAEAYLMTSLLRGVIDVGTGAAARASGLSGEVAGKTGTTNDARDAWFVGYSSRLLALVWVGFDNAEPHGLGASESAVPIWADFMKQALDAYPAQPFAVPAGITVADVDTTNGKLANRYCPLVGREVFLAGTEPTACDEHGGAVDQVIDVWRRFRDWFQR